MGHISHVGGWKTSKVRTDIIPQIIDDLPDDLVSVISEVKVRSNPNFDDPIQVTNDKLFLPAEVELFDTNHYSGGLSESPLGQFDYYKANNTDEARTRSFGNYYGYWERSGVVTLGSNTHYFCSVTHEGSYVWSGPAEGRGVALIFAI